MNITFNPQWLFIIIPFATILFLNRRTLSEDNNYGWSLVIGLSTALAGIVWFVIWAEGGSAKNRIVHEGKMVELREEIHPAWWDLYIATKDANSMNQKTLLTAFLNSYDEMKNKPPVKLQTLEMIIDGFWSEKDARSELAKHTIQIKDMVEE